MIRTRINEAKATETFSASKQTLIDRIKLYITSRTTLDASFLDSKKCYRKYLKKLTKYHHFPDFANVPERAAILAEKLIGSRLSRRESLEDAFKLFNVALLDYEPKTHAEKRHREKYLKGDEFQDPEEVGFLVKTQSELTVSKVNLAKKAEEMMEELFEQYNCEGAEFKGWKNASLLSRSA